MQIRWIVLLSRQGKVRLAKWYTTISQKDRAKILKDVAPLVLSRAPKMCNVIEWKDHKVVYKRYASLYFICGIDNEDNELLTLEVIHQFVEVLDKYFGNVCELDLIFNFHKAYYVLDELILGGELQEPSKRAVLSRVEAQDALVEAVKSGQAPDERPVITGPRG
ncbi:small chain of clathrin adaptor complex [Helicosporidium sp. ATCC 50920]|nr:small chain of clathrin adaptor complex [Helicosporidium sp. ATCC 50920]|eukprot:KDD76391.1 small chain of clathrin adaptor complex [Helicosporidium sp. ATCC 50920]